MKRETCSAILIAIFWWTRQTTA